MKPTILIAWFLVTMTNGLWHYTGPYDKGVCESFALDAKRGGASVAYCTEAP